MSFRWIISLTLVGLIGCAGADPGKAPAPLNETQATLSLIASNNTQAQTLFDRAITLTYGFNHNEAHKTYIQATEADPQCALCYWGAALVLGPNINLGMNDANVPKAHALAQKALALSTETDGVNHDLIVALSKRYAPEAVPNRSSLDAAYAEALRGVARKHSNHAVVQVLLAEALMDLHPWDYWDEAGQPKGWTPEILGTLETALKLDPANPNANHLHIHAVEASPHPEQAEASADRLRALAPDSGHLLHMPAHIYMRIGRYADAAEVNAKAIANDEAYRAHAQPKGIYPLAYMPHNRHFLWIASANSGQSRRAIEATFGMAEVVDTQKMREGDFVTLQHFHVMPLYALIRFGKWEDILKQPEPEADLVYPRGVWHYARGRALNGLNRPDEADQELAQLKTLAVDPALEKVTLWGINKTTDILAIAQHVLEGELAYRRDDLPSAVAHLKQAVTVEDGLRYDEPPAWYYPARQNLGAVLMETGSYAEAETIFRRDLERHRDNGWSLYGLWQSLKAQGKSGEAEEVKQRFNSTWAQADVTLTASRF